MARDKKEVQADLKAAKAELKEANTHLKEYMRYAKPLEAAVKAATKTVDKLEAELAKITGA